MIDREREKIRLFCKLNTFNQKIDITKKNRNF